MNSNYTNRKVHRDLGYLFLGLIISFAFSGILMNHRNIWHPEKYTISTRPLQIQVPTKDSITNKYAIMLGKQLGIEDEFRRSKVDKDMLRISFAKHDVEVDVKTGKGEITAYAKTPVISQMMKLHKSDSNWWIYYSDIFGIGLITIALTGAFMIPGNKKFSFTKRGWKLCLIGVVVPILFLIFF